MAIALTNARVFAATGEPALEAGAVVVDGERITWVGPAAEAPLAGAEVVDLDGRTVLPGFVDAHAHLVYEGVQDAYTIELAKPVEQAAIEASLHGALTEPGVVEAVLKGGEVVAGALPQPVPAGVA